MTEEGAPHARENQRVEPFVPLAAPPPSRFSVFNFFTMALPSVLSSPLPFFATLIDGDHRPAVPCISPTSSKSAAVPRARSPCALQKSERRWRPRDTPGPPQPWPILRPWDVDLAPVRADRGLRRRISMGEAKEPAATKFLRDSAPPYIRK